MLRARFEVREHIEPEPFCFELTTLHCCPQCYPPKNTQQKPTPLSHIGAPPHEHPLGATRERNLNIAPLLLLLLLAAGCCWLLAGWLLAAASCCWLLLAAASCCWQLLAAGRLLAAGWLLAAGCWLLLAAASCCCCWLLAGCVSHFQHGLGKNDCQGP